MDDPNRMSGLGGRLMQVAEVPATANSVPFSVNALVEQDFRDGTGGAAGTCDMGNSSPPSPVCFP